MIRHLNALKVAVFSTHTHYGDCVSLNLLLHHIFLLLNVGKRVYDIVSIGMNLWVRI